MSFNKEEFKKIIYKTKNSLSLTQFEKQCKIGNGYLSKVFNKDINPPSPEILKKIANNSSVSYEELMIACGYIDNIYNLPKDIIPFVLDKSNLKYIKFAKKLKENNIDPDKLLITNIIINKDYF